MDQAFKSSVGVVLSADIAIPDYERVKQFYSDILTTGAKPLWQDDLLNNRGMPIIGLGARSDMHVDLPLQWMPHIQVADVGNSVSKATDLGGKELMHGKDDQGNSQWAVIEDPNGAAFGLIPLVPQEMLPNIAKDELSHIGSIAWLDLTVSEAAKTKDFYSAIIGWGAEAAAMQDGDMSYSDFNMLDENGQALAGICHARGQNDGLPAVWLIYLPVGNLVESLERAVSQGGSVTKEYRNKSNELTLAVIKDPVGVSLGLAQA